MLGLAATVMLQAMGAPFAITGPTWVRRPSGEEVAAVFPKIALDKGLNGRVVMQCAVKADGAIGPCEVTSEDPMGVGFGEAALKLAPLFKMTAVTKDGTTVEGGTVRIPLRFTVDDGVMDTTSLVTACYGETSAKVERHPTDEEAIKAYGYFASLLAVVASRQKMLPREFEGALASARQAALRPGPDDSPGLARCMKLFRETRPASTP